MGITGILSRLKVSIPQKYRNTGDRTPLASAVHAHVKNGKIYKQICYLACAIKLEFCIVNNVYL